MTTGCFIKTGREEEVSYSISGRTLNLYKLATTAVEALSNASESTSEELSLRGDLTVDIYY